MSTDFSTPSQQERRGYPPLSALRRSRDDRKIVGVSGGLGQYAGVDPLVIRILFVVLTFFGGSGILLYALGWLLVPDQGEDESEGERLLNGRSRSSAATVIGILVVLAVGIAATGCPLDSGPGFGGLGALVARRGHRRADPVATTASRAGHPAAARPAARRTRAEPGAYGQTPGTRLHRHPAGATPHPAAYPAAPPSSYAPTAPAAAASRRARATRRTTGRRSPRRRAPKERSILGRVTLCIAAIVVGLLIGWNAATDSRRAGPGGDRGGAGRRRVSACWSGAFVGRARGLVVAGVMLVVLASVASFSGVQVRGGVGDRTWDPRTVGRAAHAVPARRRRGDPRPVRPRPQRRGPAAGRGAPGRRRPADPGARRTPSCWSTPTSAPVSSAGRTATMPSSRAAARPIDGTDLSERFTIPDASAPSAATSSSTPSSASAAWRCAVRRHDLDLFSLIAGLVFVGIALGHLLDVATDVDFDGRWIITGRPGGPRRRRPGRHPGQPGRRAAAAEATPMPPPRGRRAGRGDREEERGTLQPSRLSVPRGLALSSPGPCAGHPAGCPSGQWERTVNPSAMPSKVRILHLPRVTTPDRSAGRGSSAS